MLVVSLPSAQRGAGACCPVTHRRLVPAVSPGRRWPGWDRMADWSMPIGSLGEEVVARLCELLDNAGRGWRKLAEVAGLEKRFKCR